MAIMAPAKPRKAAMPKDEFRKRLKTAGLNLVEAAELLGVNVATVSRWRAGKTPISESSAKLIRLIIK